MLCYFNSIHLNFEGIYLCWICLHLCDSYIGSSIHSLFFPPSFPSIAICGYVWTSSAFTFPSIVFRFLSPLLPFLFSIFNMNVSFWDVKYKAFVFLLFGLPSVFVYSSNINDANDMPSTSLVFCTSRMYVSHMNVGYITITHVAIGVQCPNYFYKSFILILFLL